MGLHFQRRAIQQNTDRAEARAPLLMLAIGSFNIVLGCWNLISKAVTVPTSVIDWTLIGMGSIFVGFGLFADLRFIIRSFRNKRRAKLQQQL